MTNYLERACKYLGVDPGSAINPRVEGDEFVVIIDRGIAGCPFYRIPLSELQDPEPEPVDDLGAYDMSYRELQEVAKAEGVQANQSKAALKAALWPSDAPFGVDLFPDTDEEE